jgi:hypothetical protein
MSVRFEEHKFKGLVLVQVRMYGLGSYRTSPSQGLEPHTHYGHKPSFKLNGENFGEKQKRVSPKVRLDVYKWELSNSTPCDHRDDKWI